MDRNTDKQIENLVEKMMKGISLETPSFNFTDMVMAQVLETKTSQATVYKPLISKWIWYIVFAGIFGLMIYLNFTDLNETSGSLFESLNLKALPSFNISKAMESFHFSKITMYACVFLTLMLFIQIPVLKHYMDKQIEI